MTPAIECALDISFPLPSVLVLFILLRVRVFCSLSGVEKSRRWNWTRHDRSSVVWCAALQVAFRFKRVHTHAHTHRLTNHSVS